MEDTSGNKENKLSKKPLKHVSIGLLAHVDAGKTTLSESILYRTGVIRKAGRVDHGDTYLDTNELEKSRGITIFSKQAVFDLGDKRIVLLDTPGHADFSAEMERAVQILDYAVLIVSGADGVQGHTRTVWKLLKRYGIPVFIFINKMDQEKADAAGLMKQLKKQLDENCIAFPDDSQTDAQDFLEELAMCDEAALETYLKTGTIPETRICGMIRERTVFPCYFGSALRMQGVDALLEGMRRYTDAGETPAERFGAQVYKITRDSQGNRLTHLKVTGGYLRVKDLLSGQTKRPGEDGTWEEKVNQIRVYSGDRFEAVTEATPGMVCAVTGLSHTYAGEGLGTAPDLKAPALEPVLQYRIETEPGADIHRTLANLRILEEEDPSLQIVWNEELSEIRAKLMGGIQTEVLTRVIEERFGERVTFDTGHIIYKETIRGMVEGVGHFEPLRHYAEVHLILEPLAAGSGLVFASDCPEDMLDPNWQRLILTHLAERTHRGVLTGSAITDIRITLAAGRAHPKHTEGGDFRQATYRAVRQGLMQAQSVLLEPYVQFRMEIPQESVGRAMTDIRRMSGEFEPPQTEAQETVLTGRAPVAGMRDYQQELIAYTRGRGRLSCVFEGYFPCHNAEEVIADMGYDAQADTDHPAGSVFCAHGAGYYVPWQEVFSHMHIEPQIGRYVSKEEKQDMDAYAKNLRRTQKNGADAKTPRYNAKEEKELEEIFIRTYGKYERKAQGAVRVESAPEKTRRKREETLTEYLLVDGYNVIFAWEELSELAKTNIEGAKGRLIDILSNYQGFKQCTVILVFDAYRVEGNVQEIQRYHNIYVVHTKEAETADQYIEKVVHEIGRKYHVTVVTSDGVEQVVTLGQGGTLISAREFYEETALARKQMHEEYEARRERAKTYLLEGADPALAKEMEEIRLGKKKD